LAAAGIASYATDILIAGSVQNTLRLDFSSMFTINAGIADIALMVGFALLVLALYQGGSKIRCSMPLAPSDIAPLRFSHLPRGVDNVHIDVLLSPEFCKQSSRVIHTLVPIVIRHLSQGKQTIALPQNLLAELTSQFNALLNTSLHLAKTRGDKQMPNLFFIATLKHLHNEVTNTVATTIQRKKESVHERNRRSLGTQKDIRAVEWMFRFRERIIATTNLTLINALGGGKNRDADKIIENVLGKRNLFIQQARHIWLLKAESSADEHLLMKHYLTLGLQQEDKNSFLNIDKLLSDIFRDFVPLIASHAARERSDKHLIRDSDTLSQPSVMMNPRNITILLDTAWTQKQLKNLSRWHNWKKYRKLKKHLIFQQRLTLKLLGDLHKSDLVPWINAAYEVRSLLRNSSSVLSPVALTSMLAKTTSKTEFKQRLQELVKVSDSAPSAQAITASWERIHKQAEPLLKRNLLSFIRDFSRYRHDLALLFTYQRAAAQLSLLRNDKDIQTSRTNFSLYEFLCQSERRHADAPILSHIIIKADLRGSTDITQKLTELELNPATHFDRNFFSPINELIDNYGAEKVFIEGDAIILILNERQGDTEGRLIASHACGLAAKILQVVAKQNQELSAYGLPQLELGIGIAYSDETPRYLFDQQHRITISPAINRADRLSACAWGVRKWREKQQAAPSYVEVYQPSAKEMSHGEKAQKDLVYNLNGVLIEPEVFNKLELEISPKPLSTSLPQYPDSQLYGIEFPDLAGNPHRLVIRKAQVKVYDPDYRVGECPVVESRFFYEVIHEKGLLQQVLRAAT
jgi:class 3 adenylate cyclase